MAIKRLISDKQRSIIKNLKKFKNKNISSLTSQEKDELIELIAKKLNII